MIKRTQFFHLAVYTIIDQALFSQKRIGVNNIFLLLLWYSAFLDKSLSLTNIIQNALRQITDNFQSNKNVYNK